MPPGGEGTQEPKLHVGRSEYRKLHVLVYFGSSQISVGTLRAHLRCRLDPGGFRLDVGF